MKYLIIVLFILFFSANSFSAGAQTEAENVLDHFTVEVKGLGCPYCAYGLEKKFKDFKEISDIEIEIETGIFTFSYPAAETLSIIEVEEKVEAAGYTPVKTSITRANGEQEESGLMQVVPIDEIPSTSGSTLKVAGNCSMCKNRIEQAALKQKGVIAALWDADLQMLSLEFDAEKITLSEIAKAIAAEGHDNEKASAEQMTYENLPVCCQYQRFE